MIKGTLPPRVQGLVFEWAVMHIDDLQKIWEAIQKGESQSIKKIKPLV
jgi:hypothetical protein